MFKNSNVDCLYKVCKKRTKGDDAYSDINMSVALGKSHVPLAHKQLASNYVLIKRIFGASAAVIPITNAQRAVLARHGFMPLEHTTISQINRQIEQLKSWANSGDILLNAYATELFEIRIKELKFLRLTISAQRAIEFQNGWQALEKYILYIAR